MAISYAYSILSLKSERKSLCERLRCRWEHYVNVGLQRGVREWGGGPAMDMMMMMEPLNPWMS